MDEDRDWLKNPILPRPPAVPRFSAAELRLVEGERPSSVKRAAAKRAAVRPEQEAPLKSRRSGRQPRVPLESAATDSKSEAPQSRRMA